MTLSNCFALLLKSHRLLLQTILLEMEKAMCNPMEPCAGQMICEKISQLLGDWQQMPKEEEALELMPKKPIPWQSDMAWGALLFAGLQHWLFWVMAGVLLLAFGYCWWLRRKRFKAGSDFHSSTGGEESDEEFPDERDLGRLLPRDTKWPMQDLFDKSSVVKEVVNNLLCVLKEHFSYSFLPELQPAIGVGNAFEGWRTCQEDKVVYHLLVPLKPPQDHTFHLEMVNVRDMLAKEFRVRVTPEFICTEKNMLCLFHYPEEQPRRKMAWPSLCTGPYLDVVKIALWFQMVVKSIWKTVPQARHYDMKMLQSSRSCILKLTDTFGEKFLVEVMFGVQQNNSDIFLCSQTSKLTPSTVWSESYAVAEAKFFKHIARQVPRGNFHVKCLCFCIHVLAGRVLSPCIVKTAVMHLLTTIPVADWCGEKFMLRLQDIMQYLRRCLEKKQLNHFFIGNKKIPKKIKLPPAFHMANPINLFQQQALDPAACAEALSIVTMMEKWIPQRYSRLIRILMDKDQSRRQTPTTSHRRGR